MLPVIEQRNYRNVAIIAHVDHGKTSLVDSFLKQTKVFRDNQVEMNQEMILDSGDLEREKGITIKAKNIAVRYKDYKINIIDTPGHADFGGEVERTLNMADGCILLVDAQEGPRAQTRFVLKTALELGLVPIVVINKIDKPYANPAKALDKVHDLILTLAKDVAQLDFPVYYAIGREGLAFKELPAGDLTKEHPAGDITPLLDGIIEHIPSPQGDPTAPFQMHITTLMYDPHLGRYLIGKVGRGTIKVGDTVVVVEGDGAEAPRQTGRVRKLMVREGLEYVEVKQAAAGEIVAVGGIESKAIGATVCDPNKIEGLPMIHISDPSIKMKFEANTSPFVGQEGKFVTVRLLQDRLEREIETNISLRIEKTEGGGYYVSGRGELQLSILIEEMRREGYEFQIRKPEVILQKRDGHLFEPREEVSIEVPLEYQGSIMAKLSERKAHLIEVEEDSTTNTVNMKFTILTRKLIGLRSILLAATRGNLVMSNNLLDYVPYIKQAEIYRKGVLISSNEGTAMDYALNMIQDRGEVFVEPGSRVYEGMLLGINKYDQDMEVNPTKARAKTAVRMDAAAVTDIALRTIKPLTLEFGIAFLGPDELLEITPKSLRLRKIFLKKWERDRVLRREKE